MDSMNATNENSDCQESVRTANATATKTKVRHPSQYEVLFVNDDYTPMDFVVDILKRQFQFDHQRAVRLMMDIHREGIGVAGVFPREIAETKVVEANRYARACEHPLLCAMRKA